MNYKLTVYNSKVYKELVLKEGIEKISIGTQRDNSLCFLKEDFWRSFQVELVKQQDNYMLVTNQDLFFIGDEGIKEKVHIFKSGETLEICDELTEKSVLSLDFGLDFGETQDNYNLKISLSNVSVFTIGGGSDCDIYVRSDVLLDDRIILTKTQAGIEVDISNSRYGVKVNGFSNKNKDKILIKNKQFLEYCGNFFYLEDDIVYTSDSGAISTRLSCFDDLPQKNHYNYPQFIRSVRQKYVDLDEEPEVLPPKEAPTEPKRNIIKSMLPLICSFTLMVLIRGRMMSNKLYILYFAGTMLIGAGMSVWNYFDNSKDYRKKSVKRIKVYNEYLDKKEEELTELREEERTLISEKNRSLEETVQNIEDFSSKLFEKDKDNDDFLSIRIGTGKVKSACQVKFKKQEYVETEDALKEYPEKVHDKYEYIENMPVVLQLGECNAIGVVGTKDKLYQMMKNMIISVSGQHFYEDVKEYLIISKEDVELFEWTRWIKHFTDESTGMRFIIHDEDSSKRGLDFLYGELSAREGIKEKERAAFAHFVVYIYDSKKFMEHPVKEYVDHAKELGFTFVFFEEFEEMLHKACDKRLFLEPDKYHGFIQDTHDGKEVQYFDYPHISRDIVVQCARKLAPVHVKELSLESTLTKNISFYQLHNILNANDLDLAQRWADSKVYESMAAPLGVKSGDEIVCLDLHEKYHGPHGLVAGTTGSGKSEIMQSYILSIATLFHPYDVSFIIIDFKGGGMANQFRNLPHLNGAITNIDGKQINRSLKSIKAELIKRQELFAKYEVNQIDNYIRLYKEGKTDVPLPHLILLVDEFAELKAEQPEFMKELISTARIGRSLGVHLILATQKPSGVVNDQIWSNSKFKLCLKVQEKSDSNEVLHSPLAAEIREPGRAYLQVGNNEIFELFQSAYSGAPAYVQSTNNRRKFQISSVSLSGKRDVVYEQKPEKQEASITQLEAVVEHVDEYCKQAGIPKLPDICLPPLSEVIPYPEDMEVHGTDITVPIGIYDDPDRQAQDEFEFNFTRNHGYILGSSLSGKTTLLQGMIMGLTTKYSPRDVNIYIIDFASMMLRVFERLNHVGCVATISDEDKIKNLIKMLVETISRRRKMLADKGLSSYSAYREAGYTDEPQIVFIIENYTVFKATCPDYEESILAICRDGVANGISVVISNQQMSGIGFRLMSNIAYKIALYCNDKSQYTSLFDRCKLFPDEVPGRGVTRFGTEIKEFQSYIAFSTGKEIERVSKIKEYIEQINARYPDERADRIKYVPSDLSDRFIDQTYGSSGVVDNRLIIGLNYKSTLPEYLEFVPGKIISISGREDMGRSEFSKYCVRKMASGAENSAMEMYVLDSNNKAFKQYDNGAFSYYSDNEMDAIDMIDIVYQKVTAQDKEKDSKLKVLILGSRKVLDIIRNDEATCEKYSDIAKNLKQYKVCIMLTDVPNISLTAMGNPLYRQVRDAADHVFFENVRDIAFITLPTQILTAVKTKQNFGDAFYIDTSKFRRIKTPLEK